MDRGAVTDCLIECLRVLEVSFMATIERSIDPLVPRARPELQEFLRRFEAMPHLKSAELVGGIVYVPLYAVAGESGPRSEG